MDEHPKAAGIRLARGIVQEAIKRGDSADVIEALLEDHALEIEGHDPFGRKQKEERGERDASGARHNPAERASCQTSLSSASWAEERARELCGHRCLCHYDDGSCYCAHGKALAALREAEARGLRESLEILRREDQFIDDRTILRAAAELEADA